MKDLGQSTCISLRETFPRLTPIPVSFIREASLVSNGSDVHPPARANHWLGHNGYWGLIKNLSNATLQFALSHKGIICTESKVEQLRRTKSSLDLKVAR